MKISKRLQEATDNLSINDVYAHQIEGVRNPDDVEIPAGKQLSFQTMHGLASIDYDFDDEKMARISFKSGVRWTVNPGEPDSDEEPIIVAVIEAIMVASYAVKAEVSEQGLRDFAIKCSGMHVWPYWRELVSSMCDRMRLPPVTLPITQFSVEEPKLKSENE